MISCQRALLAQTRRSRINGLFGLVFGAILFFGVSACTATAQAPDSLEAIAADYAALRVATNPTVAARGTGTGPRAWPQVTPDAITYKADMARRLQARLSLIETDRAIDIAILEHLLTEISAQDDQDSARVPFTGDSGFHAAPIFAASRTRLRTVADGEAYIARLRDTPRFFNDNIENMRRGIATGWTAHTDPLNTVREQVREQIVSVATDSDLYAPFTSLPSDMATPDKLRLQRQGADAVEEAIAAYRQLDTFFETEYAPKARALPGLASLEGGRAIYAQRVAHHTAGAGLTPEDIHAIGQAEVTRIRNEMMIIIEEVGFEGSLEGFLTFLRTDQRFYARTPQDLIEKASTISKRLDAILPRYFNHLPRLPYGVSPVPASIAPGYTTGRYAQGDAELGRSGTYLVNTYRLDQRPLYELPALTAHEAVPGHHLQIALAQEMENMPDYRRGFYATAFGEGWALYAEKLAGEAGIYQTPYERFGALSYEMWRACRLVADTGLHWYGWSRVQAEACFIENTALSPLNIETEVTRYIGWPGQAVAYKIGELRILDLRSEARAALGQAFDIRAFHDHLLAAGSMPLSTLSARMRAWIAAESAQLVTDQVPPTTP